MVLYTVYSRESKSERYHGADPHVEMVVRGVWMLAMSCMLIVVGTFLQPRDTSQPVTVKLG